MKNTVMQMLQTFRADESGATAIEYGLMVGMMGLAILAAVNVVAGEAVTPFDNVATSIGGVND